MVIFCVNASRRTLMDSAGFEVRTTWDVRGAQYLPIWLGMLGFSPTSASWSNLRIAEQLKIFFHQIKVS